ncbi:MAG TPA: serpin family protein [Polyangia bacterium]|nr:serpin family protein [Polyangia bacterium]
MTPLQRGSRQPRVLAREPLDRPRHGIRRRTRQHRQSDGDRSPFSLPAERLHPTFDALDLAIEPAGDGHLVFANALWADSRVRVLPEYLDLLAEDYGVGVHIVDFARAPPEADPLEALLATSPTTTFSVSMPQFTARGALPLTRTLAAMGMADAFTRAVDFSGINGAQDLFIDNVVHQAVVAVDYQGTTASAATAVTFATKLGVEVAEPLVLDHPFLFAIRHDATGAILFLGRVVDPSTP